MFKTSHLLLNMYSLLFCSTSGKNNKRASAKAFARTVDTARKCILQKAVHQISRKKNFHGAHNSNNYDVALPVLLNFLGQCWYITTTVAIEHFQSACQRRKKKEVKH